MPFVRVVIYKVFVYFFFCSSFYIFCCTRFKFCVRTAYLLYTVPTTINRRRHKKRHLVIRADNTEFHIYVFKQRTNF